MNRDGEGHDGVFVVFEGIDGAGTTTQAERYAAYQRGRRRFVHVTREPSSGPIGSLIRSVLIERVSLPTASQAEIMTLLFAADRLDHVDVEVAPHLREGSIVISDRYDLSSLAYQSATVTDGRDPAVIVEWIRQCNRHARRPDVTVVLDTSPEIAAARRRLRGGAREIFDDLDLQARLAQAYRRAELLVPGDRVLHVSGDEDTDTVTQAIIKTLEPIVDGGSSVE
jgi:dTMP kinase